MLTFKITNIKALDSVRVQARAMTDRELETEITDASIFTLSEKCTTDDRLALQILQQERLARSTE